MVANTPKLVAKDYKSHIVANGMVTLWLISISDIIDQVKCVCLWWQRRKIKNMPMIGAYNP